MNILGDSCDHAGDPVDLVVAHCYLGHFKKLRIIIIIIIMLIFQKLYRRTANKLRHYFTITSLES